MTGNPHPAARAVSAGARSAAVAAVLLTLSLALCRPCPAGAREQEIHTRAATTVRILAEVPADARAVLLLFEGAQGLLQRGYQGFAHRVFDRFPPHGIGAVLMDAPADKSGFRGGLDPRFRESARHIADIDGVVAALKRDYGLPVWILGVSNGTRSAASYAMHRSKDIGGVVLVSSSTTPPNGTPIGELPGIARITVPLLAVAHRDDACLGSPPSGAAQIANAATASPHAAAMFFTGGENDGPLPCGTGTHHQLHGNEDDVVDAVVWFIDAYTARPAAPPRRPDGAALGAMSLEGR